MESAVFEAAGGGQAFIDLAHARHQRCLQDPRWQVNRLNYAGGLSDLDRGDKRLRARSM